MTDPRLVILAHGSADTRGRLPCKELTASVAGRHREDKVRVAYVEFVHRTLAEKVQEAAADGKTDLQVLPLFLAAGAHVADDIPRQIADYGKYSAPFVT